MWPPRAFFTSSTPWKSESCRTIHGFPLKCSWAQGCIDSDASFTRWFNSYRDELLNANIPAQIIIEDGPWYRRIFSCFLTFPSRAKPCRLVCSLSVVLWTECSSIVSRFCHLNSYLTLCNFKCNFQNVKWYCNNCLWRFVMRSCLRIVPTLSKFRGVW